MAVLLTKSHRQGHMIFLRHLLKPTTKPDPFPLSKDSSSPHQCHQRKWFTRLPNSSSQKAKVELANPASSRFGLVNWYLGMLETRPIVTKSITCGLIYSAADLSAQTIEGGASKGYDLVRTLRMGGFALLISGPLLHYWFRFVSTKFPERNLTSTFKKVGLAQAIFDPGMILTFFSINAALQGENSSEIAARLKRDFLPTWFNGIMYWPICDFVTFKFAPVHFQPLVSNVFSFIWSVYMTYVASLEKAVAN